MSENVGTFEGGGSVPTAMTSGTQDTDVKRTGFRGRISKIFRPSKLHVSSVRMALFSFVLAAFAFMFAFSASWGKYMDRLEGMSSSDVFANMNLSTLDGGSFTNENLRNARLTLFNVWSTTCSPCIREMPELEELNHSYEPGQIQVVGIVSDAAGRDGTVKQDKVIEARNITRDAGVTFPSLIMDKSTYAYVMTAIVGTPSTFFVDSSGNIRSMATGAKNLETWKALVDEELASLDEEQ